LPREIRREAPDLAGLVQDDRLFIAMANPREKR